MKGTFVHGYSVELELAICWTGIITSVMYYFWSIQRLFLDGQKRSTVYRTKHSTKSKRVSPGAPVQESKRKPLYRAAQESPLCVSCLDGIEQRGKRALSMELSDQLANDVGVRDFANDTYGSPLHLCDGQHQNSEASLRNLVILEFQLDKLICQQDLEKNQAPLLELSGSSSTFSDIPRAEDARVSKPDAKIHNLKAQVTNHLLSRTSGPGSQPGVVVVWPQVGTLEPCGKAKYVVESKPPRSCASADLQAKDPNARFGKHKISSAIMIQPNSGSSSIFSEKLRAEDARESEPVAKMHNLKAQVTNHLLSRMSDPGSHPGVVVVCGRRRKCPHTQQQRLGLGRSSFD
jgi:hypothetical protein